MRLEDLDYELPPERIAAQPAEPRDAARLMVIRRATGVVEHRAVRDLASDESLLRHDDLMVFNRSKVVPARFESRRATTGGRVGGLFLHAPKLDVWEVLLEARGTLRVNDRLRLGHEGSSLQLLEHLDTGRWLAQLESPLPTLTLLERIGSTPLPPYIVQRRKTLHAPALGPEDPARYNTVYADAPGSVAAPTAGLHFTQALLAQLRQRGVEQRFVTLHVGLGTFAPVRTAKIEDHPIHREAVAIPPEVIASLRAARERQRRIVVVGTTTVRAVESLPRDLPLAGHETHTDLFIRPGFDFRFTDGLLTNFHLPRSTLLAMVAALPGVGIERLLQWYRIAVQQDYRFYSYGDAMLLLP